MLPWIRCFWSGLSVEDKQELSQQSVVICSRIRDPYAIKTGVELIRGIIKKFPAIGTDVSGALEAIDSCPDHVQPVSDIELLAGYFQQFASKAKKTAWAAPVKAVQSGCRRFLTNNGCHGQIAVNLVSEDDKNYVFEYVKDGEVIFSDWKLKKSSPRVIREL